MPQDFTDAPLSDFTDAPLASSPPSLKTGSALAQSLLSKVPHPEVDIVKGAAEGALSTARNIAGVLPKGWQDALSAVRQRMGVPPVAELTKPANLTQAVGKGAEQIGEFFVPGSLLEKVAPGLGATSKMLAAFGGNAAVATAQGAGPVGAGVAGALGAAGEAPRLTSGITDWAANRIEKSVIKASSRDYQNGFNPANVFKYDLGGSPGETVVKSSQKLNDLGAQMKTVLGSNPNAPPVDVTGIRDRVLASWKNNPDAVKALDRIEQAMAFRLNGEGITPKLIASGRIGLDLPDANIAKQAVGDLGAWLTDSGGKVVSDADQMTEAVANRYYAELKKEIQQNALSAGPAVQGLNRQMADIIPVRAAALRRFPIAERQNVVSLLDAIALASGHIPLGVMARALHSGEVAQALSRGVGIAPIIAQPAAAGVSAVSQQLEQK